LFEIAGMHAGIVLTSALASPEDAGVYNAVIRVALAGTLALQALRLAVAPRMSRMLTNGDVAGVEHVHQASTTWVVLLSFPLYLVFAAWPGHLLALFGPEFRAGSVALTILAGALLVNLATGNVATVLLMSGRSGLTLAITAVSLGIGIALTVALAPAFGVVGAAIAKATSVVFENLAVAVVVRYEIGVRTSCRPLWRAVALAACCFALPPLALHLAGTPGTASALATVCLGTAVYLAACWRLRETFQLAAVRAVVPAWLTRRGQRPPTTESRPT
jgi:O-antigen/teichoic acid export membrane protein